MVDTPTPRKLALLYDCLFSLGSNAECLALYSHPTGNFLLHVSTLTCRFLLHVNTLTCRFLLHVSNLIWRFLLHVSDLTGQGVSFY